MDAIDQILAIEGEKAVWYRLPKLLRDIADLIGVRGAYVLAHRFGGTRIAFTGRGSHRTKLENLIGEKSASTLHGKYGAELVSIPKARWLTLFLRNRNIIRRWNDGEPAAALARRFRLTERQVYYIVAAHPRKLTTERQK